MTSGAGRTPSFGMYIPNQHPRDADMKAALAMQIDFVRTARGGGWDSVWTGQHFLTRETSQLSTIVTLSRLAAEAGDLSLGIGLLLLPLLNPVEVAEHVASLDVVAGGGVIAGVGIGYRDLEYSAFGVPKADAVRRFEENLVVLRSLLSAGGTEARLPWCALDEAQLSLEPARVPPIWMGANADGAVRRAARTADAWLINPHATLTTIARQVTMYDRERARLGLPQAVARPLFREVICAPTQEEARELAARFVGAKYKTYSHWGQADVLADNDTFSRDFDDLADGRFVVGTPRDCVALLRRWQTTIGVDYFIFRTHWSGMPRASFERSVKLLTNEVVPLLRDR